MARKWHEGKEVTKKIVIKKKSYLARSVQRLTALASGPYNTRPVSCLCELTQNATVP